MTLLIIAYLGGALTIFSPCILPILPFVFARATQPFMRSTLPMLIGMAATFALVATLAAIGGSWAIDANSYGRLAAILLLTVFGVSLISPRVASIVTQPVVDFGNRLLNASSAPGKVPTIAGSFILGIATGLLWAPCAGPILGLVLTGAALQGANLQTTFLLLAYAAGAATSLAIALSVGGRLFAAMKRSLGFSEGIRKAVGVAVLAGVAAIALGLDTGVLGQLSYAKTASFEQAVLDNVNRRQDAAKPFEVASNGAPVMVAKSDEPFRSDLPVEARAPSLDGAVDWLNSEPLTMEQLRGKVVLVDFWTYGCVNCVNTLPHVTELYSKYRDRGLVVIGVHTPEFPFEHSASNVQAALKRHSILYPVAQDNNSQTWNAYGNQYWPAQYIIDQNGKIVFQHAGEGRYDEIDRTVARLLNANS